MKTFNKQQSVFFNLTVKSFLRRKTIVNCYFIMALMLFSSNVNSQTADKVIISSGWQMQDAAIICQEGKRAGWEMVNSAQYPQEGKEISRLSYKPVGWYKATVPGTVLTTLVNNGVYPEPLYGENNRPEIIPESLCRTDWWYRNIVTIPDSFKDKTVWINFDGINYEAEIWVNSERVGPVKGAFIRGKFDITSFVKPGKEAAIAVRISPQPHKGVPFEHIMASVGGPCGGVGRLDGPTFSCSVGWDWMSGVRDRNSGIWQNVYLSASGPVILKDPLITTDLPLPRTDQAFVTIQTSVQNTTNKIQKGVIKGSFGDITFEKQVEIKPWNTMTYIFEPNTFSQLKVDNPKLWWPNGLGDPNLYFLKLSFEIDGQVSDSQDINFGIREVSYDREGRDKLGLTVNGVQVFCKGGNWGMDEALKRIPRERLEAQVRLHKEANFNMIRNWGGQSTSDDLYDLCDKYGIMLWDEFFQFNQADPIDLDLFLSNVRDKVLRYRNHPSIVIWCGRNEAYPPKFLDDATRNLLVEIDPLRWYQSNSGHGRGCSSGGPYRWQTPVQYNRFNEQSGFNKSETFKTEIGPPSIPTLESIQGMMPEKDWQSLTDAWAEKNFISGRGRDLPAMMAKRYGEIVNVADFVRKAQMMNYEGYRAMYEGRLGQMYNPVEGVLTWMSHPAQPSLVWQIYHYDMDQHASFFATKKACEQVHIQFNEIENGIVQVINHQPVLLSGMRGKLTIYNMDGSVALQNEYNVIASPCSVTKVCDVQRPASLTPVHFIKLELYNSSGSLVSDNLYWRGSASNPDDMTSLESMPVVKLSAKAKVRNSNGKVFIDVSLRNPDKSVALMTHLQLHRSKSGDRVLPAFYSDNYISLAPKEEKVITIEASESNLKGENPLVLIDGWNVSVSPSSHVSFNKNTDVSNWPQNGFGFVLPEQEPKSEVRINCAGYNRGDFSKDPGFLEGVVAECQEIIDVSAPMAGPEELYRLARLGECSYISLMKAKPAQSYKVRLHFAEIDKKVSVGQRCFDVVINGKTVIANLDVVKEADGKLIALVKEVRDIIPDSEQKITIEFKKGAAGSPQIAGFEIIPQ
jgi:Beta-galactosidase/beta-glucuronidase